MAEKPNEFSKYADALAMREKEFRTEAPKIANMTSPLQNISQQTGALQNINPQEIASISGLANIQATAAGQSTAREKSGARLVKRMPAYVNSYRNYLKWRYPTRYGGGSGGGAFVPSYQVPDISQITSTPKYEKK